MEKTLTGQEDAQLKYDPDNPLVVGGQAVIEGVMMRAPGRIATAVRRSNGEIVIRKQEHKSLGERYRFFRLPILRGAAGLLEMMFVGIDTLNFSAEVAMHDIQEAERAQGNGQAAKRPASSSRWKIALTVIVALLVGIGIFFVMPLVVTTRLFNVEQDAFWFNIVAGMIRLTVLVGYLLLIALMKDVKRLFEYHGAEHKAVYTFESQGDLLVETARHYTRFHPRCGTSFILIVMVTAMLLFSLLDSVLMLWLGALTLPIRLVTHLPLIPLVGGVAYEFIRWSARRSTTAFGRILVAPGLWLQRITTSEPDTTQMEVALVALKCALGLDDQDNVRLISKATELSTL